MFTNKLDWPKKIKGVIFDVDGLLYSNNLLYTLIFSRLIFEFFLHPRRIPVTITGIRSYRNAQELLRQAGSRYKDLSNAQLQKASQEADIDSIFLSEIIEFWIYKLPLRFIKYLSPPGMLKTFHWLKENKFRVGLFSDYPCAEKAKVLGIESYVDIMAHSMEEDIGVFKPDHRGFIIAANRLELAPQEIAYVGDRPDVDGEGAFKAGMLPVIMNKHYRNSEKYIFCSSWKSLRSIILHYSN